VAAARLRERPVSAPARVRDLYVIGKLGSYFLPTVESCDKTLRELRTGLQMDRDRCLPAGTARRVRADLDAVLDRRTELALAEATAEAKRLARED
jgi:hypothetical protein